MKQMTTTTYNTKIETIENVFGNFTVSIHDELPMKTLTLMCAMNREERRTIDDNAAAHVKQSKLKNEPGKKMCLSVNA